MEDVALHEVTAGNARRHQRLEGPEYVAYRMARTPQGYRWRGTPLRLIQLSLFLLCLGALARAGVDVFTWRSAALLCWSLALARKEIRIALRGAHRLDGATKKDPHHEDHRPQRDRPASA